MKYLIALSLILTLTGCKLPKSAGAGDNIDAPSYVKDVWEYSNDDGQCANGEWFGDSSNGCVKAAQLVRFSDGSAFVTLNLGTDPALQWAWSKYLYPGEALNETLNLGRNVRFNLAGDIQAEVPDLEVSYDHTRDFTDTPPAKIALVQVFVGSTQEGSTNNECQDGKGNNKCNGEGSK